MKKNLDLAEKRATAFQGDANRYKELSKKLQAELNKTKPSPNTFSMEDESEDVADASVGKDALADEIASLKAKNQQLKDDLELANTEKEKAVNELKFKDKQLKREQNFTKLEDLRKEMMHLCTGALVMFLFRKCIFLHKVNMKQEALVTKIFSTDIVTTLFDELFKILTQPVGGKKKSGIKPLNTKMYCFDGKHPFDEKDSRGWLWDRLGLEFVKKFCHKRNAIAFVMRNVFDVWTTRENPDTDMLKKVLSCCLHPRKEDKYVEIMHDIFAFMCFMESSRGIHIVKHPFVTEAGQPSTGIINKNSMVSDLSTAAYESLNGKSVSSFLFPTEEVFCCLTLAKYLFYVLQKKSVDLKEFRCPETKNFPVTPFQKVNNSSYTQTDRDFFYSQIKVVSKCFDRDQKETDAAKKSFLFDFTAKISRDDDDSDDDNQPSSFINTGNNAAAGANKAEAVEETVVFNYGEYNY